MSAKDAQTHMWKKCKELEISPLILSDNGSKAWGYDSPESDYDLKSVFVFKDQDKYRGLWDLKDVYEHKVGDLYDYTFWDLKKFMRLLYSGNAQTYEITHSPKIYWSTYYSDLLTEFTYKICMQNRLRVAYHYYGLAYKTYKERVRNVGEPTVKKYLYVLRPLMHIEYMINEQKLPNLDFKQCMKDCEDMFTPDVMRQVRKIVRLKKKGDITTANKERFPELDKLCEDYLERYKGNLENYFPEQKVNHCTIREEFDTLYQKLAFDEVYDY